MTFIASHRGGTLEFGDSTPQGFAATAAMALEQVEFDVHPTSDGAIIVHHDATLDRTTDRTGAINAQTEAEVRTAVINYGAGAHPITIQELCAIYRPSAVNLRCEIKPDEHGQPIATSCRRSSIRWRISTCWSARFSPRSCSISWTNSRP